jgi:hypothetical protein
VEHSHHHAGHGQCKGSERGCFSRERQVLLFALQFGKDPGLCALSTNESMETIYTLRVDE